MASSPASMPTIVRTAAALVVGSELLSGKIRDQNLFELSRTLRALGIDLRRVIICPDEAAVITHDLKQLLADHDVVFTSGGLGPTHDDVTVAAVCDALGVERRSSPEMLKIIEKIYGNQTIENHRLMAQIPEGARLVDTGGWPIIVAGRTWLLPGVPELFKSKLEAVRSQLRGPCPIFSASLRVTVEEALIKEELDLVVCEFPNVDIGSYPKWSDPSHKTLITVDGRDESEVARAHQSLTQRLRTHLVQS